MKKYWILDRDNSPQGLPLSKLVKAVKRMVPEGSHRLAVRRSRGYGSTVSRWDDLLDSCDLVEVTLDELDDLVSGGTEWFYDLEARCEVPDGEVSFGVHDSTALYVDAPDIVASNIVADFKDARINEDS